MIIDFKKIDATAVANFKGGEGEYISRTYLDGQNRIMQGLLHPGASIGMHMHERNSETYYIISGKGHVVMDDGTEDRRESMLHSSNSWGRKFFRDAAAF